jgi:hypothetical protein
LSELRINSSHEVGEGDEAHPPVASAQRGAAWNGSEVEVSAVVRRGFPPFVAYREERKERIKKREKRVAAARGREKGGAARVRCRGDKERGQVRCCVGGEDHGTMCVSPVLSL